MAAPCWLRLERLGQTVIAAHSPDGASWTEAGRQILATLPSAVLVGPAITSRIDGALATADFDNISVLALASDG